MLTENGSKTTMGASRQRLRAALLLVNSLIIASVVLLPVAAHAHLVNSGVGDFYAGMRHPLTSMEHVLPMVALALLASQVGKQAARMTIFLFPMALCIGILAGSRSPLVDIFHFANLAVLAILGGLIVFPPR